jgi:hypothetical protein
MGCTIQPDIRRSMRGFMRAAYSQTWRIPDVLGCSERMPRRHIGMRSIPDYRFGLFQTHAKASYRNDKYTRVPDCLMSSLACQNGAKRWR